MSLPVDVLLPLLPSVIVVVEAGAVMTTVTILLRKSAATFKPDANGHVPL